MTTAYEDSRIVQEFPLTSHSPFRHPSLWAITSPRLTDIPSKCQDRMTEVSRRSRITRQYRMMLKQPSSSFDRLFAGWTCKPPYTQILT